MATPPPHNRYRARPGQPITGVASAGTRAHQFFIVLALLIGGGIFYGLYAILDTTPLLAYLGAINGVTFIVCGIDKSVAGSAALRTPERVLLGLALVGGTIGLLLGMNLFRHKTRKTQFQFKLFVVLALQAAALRYLHR